jgi:DNA-binding MarR family transcriptional regulator
MDQNQDTVSVLMDAFSKIKRIHRGHYFVPELKPSEVFVLYKLGAHGGDNGGIKVTDISAKLDVTPPFVTQLITGLETAGYVCRNRDENDRRIVLVSLTDKGKKVLQDNHDSFVSVMEGLIEFLGEEDSRLLASLLLKAGEYFNEKIGHGCRRDHRAHHFSSIHGRRRSS